MAKQFHSLLITLIVFFSVSFFTEVKAQSFDTQKGLFDYFKYPKRYRGHGVFFNGVVEISTRGQELVVYVNDAFLSSLGLERNGQKFLFGDYVKMAVYVQGRTYPIVIHLPNKQHPYGYFYFEPIPTSTNRNLAYSLRIPVETGWMWVEPDVQNGRGTLIWHTDCKTKPTPIIYKLIE